MTLRSRISWFAALLLVSCGDDTSSPDIDTDTDDSTSTSGLPTTGTTSTTSSTTGDPTDTDPGTSTTDPGTTSDSDGSSGTSGADEVCGDGIVQGDEVCDDGNVYDGDACSADCSTEAECVVPVTHATIQAAMDDGACPTVFVLGGTYTENVTIARSVNVVGVPATDPVVVDGGAAGSVFDISGTIVVTLANMTISNGAADLGAGIATSALQLNLDNVIVDGNASTNVNPAFGAGIHATGDVTLNGSAVTNNTLAGSAIISALGAGIYIEGATLVVTAGSSIEDNAVTVANDGSFVGGGGIAALASNVLIDGTSSVSNNALTVTASSGDSSAVGGGLFANGGLTVVSNAHIDGNTISIADGGEQGAAGGGIFSIGPLVVEDGSTVSSNQVTVSGNGNALLGAGIYAQGPLGLTFSTVADNTGSNTISGNEFTTLGGGVHQRSDGDEFAVLAATISGNTLTTNTPGEASGTTGGGGFAQEFFSAATGTIANTTFSGNTVTGNDAGVGGGYYVESVGIDTNNVRLLNSTFSGNTVDTDGFAAGGGFGIDAPVGGVFLDVGNVTVTDNAASDQGGGFWSDAGEASIGVTIANSLVWGNTATDGETCYSFDVTSEGFNLFEDTTECSMGGVTEDDLTPADPMLSALADNGGPTQTHEIAGASPAADAGNPIGCTDFDGGVLANDQRGLPRNGNCDVGSYEIQ